MSDDNLAKLSSDITLKALDLIKEMIDAGRSNMMQGYASTILITDFLFKAGITSQEAKDRVFILGDIMSAVATAGGIADIFTGGDSPFAPRLTTYAKGGAGLLAKGEKE